MNPELTKPPILCSEQSWHLPDAKTELLKVRIPELNSDSQTDQTQLFYFFSDSQTDQTQLFYFLTHIFSELSVHKLENIVKFQYYTYCVTHSTKEAVMKLY